MRVLVTGSGGQLGAELARAFAGRGEVIACDRAALDLSEPGTLATRVREMRPDVILNAAAYTAVDRAEAEEDAARAVNATAVGVLGGEARRAGALLVHYSTDYVFDGGKPDPYVETDEPAPLNAYGRTKLEGERRLGESGCDHLVLRTSWVYGPRGANFLLTMLRLGESREELRIVADQHGAPTSTLQLARATAQLVMPEGELSPRALQRLRVAGGVYHATASGETTWHGFAQAIFEARRAAGAARVPRLVPIPSSEYPTPARRPANSVLSSARLASTFGVRIGDWRRGLDEVLSALDAG